MGYKEEHDMRNTEFRQIAFRPAPISISLNTALEGSMADNNRQLRRTGLQWRVLQPGAGWGIIKAWPFLPARCSA